MSSVPTALRDCSKEHIIWLVVLFHLWDQRDTVAEEYKEIWTADASLGAWSLCYRDHLHSSTPLLCYSSFWWALKSFISIVGPREYPYLGLVMLTTPERVKQSLFYIDSPHRNPHSAACFQLYLQSECFWFISPARQTHTCAITAWSSS